MFLLDKKFDDDYIIEGFDGQCPHGDDCFCSVIHDDEREARGPADAELTVHDLYPFPEMEEEKWWDTVSELGGEG